MKHLPLFTIGFLVAATPLHAGDKAVKQTIVYVQKLQTESGGFKPYDGKGDIKILPSLRATSSAVRALNYLGGNVPNKDTCIRFVLSCYDKKSGGFSDRPGGQTDVVSTAVGLMALVELKVPLDNFDLANDYLTENAKGFEDIRIAAAAFEAIKERAPRADKWAVEVFKLQNKDGTFGQGPETSRDTGGSVVTLLRLNRIPPVPGVYLKAFKNGQRQNGGWGKAEDEIASDLESTYRVMRCLHMMKSKPGDSEGVRSFVAKCRNADGGYGVAPGQPSSVSGTYFAAIILKWLDGE